MLVGALLFVGIVSASIHVPVARQEVTATAVTPTATGPVFQSITGCHFHGTDQYCMAEGTEYQVVGEATGTVDQPSSYTGCHNHGTDKYCFFPTGNGEVRVIGAEATFAITGTAVVTPEETAPEITAVTDCHLSDSSVFCTADATEYFVQTAITKTEDVPPAFTGCHAHGAELYCWLGEEEAPVIPVEDIESGAADPNEKHCHFHAGVEHCVGPGESENGGERNCEKIDRDYDIPLRIGILFVVLVVSSIGVFGPVLISRFIPIKSNIFLTVLKQFGTGVILSTAFVHLYTHADLMFGNSCLTGIKYEGTTSAIVMAGIFISFLIEYIVHRMMRWQASKKSETDDTFMSPQAVANAEMTNITIMEAGIIFHSLLIGLTLVVAGDSYFGTLAIVIVFHQLFEGIALGTRIASLGHGTGTAGMTAHFHGHSHDAPAPVDRSTPSQISLSKKLLLASGFALVTPIGMAIGIGVLDSFNGNDPSTIVAIGTLDAFSAGILVWVGLVEMLAQDWLLGGELTHAGWITTSLSMFGLVAGMVLMSFLGKWA